MDALQLWEIMAKQTGSLGPDYDYSKQGNMDERGHGSDKGKMPWHPTFSNQSAFATKEKPGGQWGRDFMGDTFTPSQNMVEQGWFEAQKNYMREVEPNTRIFRP